MWKIVLHHLPNSPKFSHYCSACFYCCRLNKTSPLSVVVSFSHDRFMAILIHAVCNHDNNCFLFGCENHKCIVYLKGFAYSLQVTMDISYYLYGKPKF